MKQTAEKSKRYPFIAEHRGGPLTMENHRKLMGWARECSEHVLCLINQEVDNRLLHALEAAKAWENGKLQTGEARKAAVMAHAKARQSGDPVMKAVARSVGQAVATAHMADHALGGAFYALKAVKLAKKEVGKESAWQLERLNQLPSAIIGIVWAMWEKKALDNRI